MDSTLWLMLQEKSPGTVLRTVLKKKYTIKELANRCLDVKKVTVQIQGMGERKEITPEKVNSAKGNKIFYSSAYSRNFDHSYFFS